MHSSSIHSLRAVVEIRLRAVVLESSFSRTGRSGSDDEEEVTAAVMMIEKKEASVQTA